MSGLLNSNTSFSSKQELMELEDFPVSGGPSPSTPSPPNSQIGGPLGSGPIRPISSTGTEGPIGPCIFTGASTHPEQLNEMKASPHGETPMGSRLISAPPDQLCGWGALRPKSIQVFNTPQWFLFFLCVASFLQGMIINGFINTVVTTIERRFDLRSYQAGLIASSYDIAACLCLTFVSYFGGTGHKPHWLGWGVMIMAFGSLVFALPHFTTPPYQVRVPQQTGMCSANRTITCQDEEGGGLSRYCYVFMLGQFLHGIGATPLYTLGVTFLDENVKFSYAPVYIGIFYTAAIVGPAAGYLLGGYFLNIYTEIHLITEMTTENPFWVGAWWIGFLAGGAAALLNAFPILGYPRQLPGSQEFAAMRVSEVHQLKDGSHNTASDPQFGKSVRDMPKSMLLLLKNPTFVCLCLAGATEATLIAGMSTFGPKFLESQFSLSASEAATWFGYMVVPAGGGGTLLGSYIIKRLKLRCRGIIRFCMVCAIISLLAIFIFLLHCPDVPMAGVTAPYQFGLTGEYLTDFSSQLHHINRSLLEETLVVGCNANCSCNRELYNPVCGADGVMYYSPCHAGCSTINHTERSTGKQVFSGCSCVVGNMSWSEEGFALSGKCGNSCNHMPALLFFLFIIIFFTFLCSIPALTATLRCVPDSQKSFGLGIQWIVVRTLGSIPGPIAFGSLIDISCILWQDQCGHQGSCYHYHNAAMSHYTLVAGIIYKVMLYILLGLLLRSQKHSAKLWALYKTVLGTIFFMLASILYQPPSESPQSNCESKPHEGGDNQPVTDLQGGNVNLYTRL